MQPEGSPLALISALLLPIRSLLAAAPHVQQGPSHMPVALPAPAPPQRGVRTKKSRVAQREAQSEAQGWRRGGAGVAHGLAQGLRTLGARAGAGVAQVWRKVAQVWRRCDQQPAANCSRTAIKTATTTTTATKWANVNRMAIHSLLLHNAMNYCTSTYLPHRKTATPSTPSFLRQKCANQYLKKAS